MSLTLESLGNYLIAQVELGAQSTAANKHSRGIWLQIAELSVAFATLDGGGISPIIEVGETPLSPDDARSALQGLTREVVVARVHVHQAPPAARGRLLMRLLLPRPKDPPSLSPPQLAS